MDARPTLTERTRRRAVDEVAAAAVELFTSQGFESTSVEAIAQVAGCSPRTFYRYFGTKEDAAFHDVADMVIYLRAALTARLEDDGTDLWVAVSETVVEVLGRYGIDEDARSSRRMELWMREPALKTRYLQHVMAAEQAMARTLSERRGLDPGRDDKAQLMAIAAIGAYRAALGTHGGQWSGRAPADHLRQLLSSLGVGLAPRPAT